jgi:hypothetical protein
VRFEGPCAKPPDEGAAPAHLDEPLGSAEILAPRAHRGGAMSFARHRPPQQLPGLSPYFSRSRNMNDMSVPRLEPRPPPGSGIVVHDVHREEGL